MLTLRLFHGRRSPDEQPSDWGRDGPTLGPLRSVNATYCEELRLETTDGVIVELRVVRGLVYYGGVLYGDFEISNELQATEQANLVRAELESPAFRKAMREWAASEKRLLVSKRFVATAAVFLDAVRETEGEAVAEELRLHLTKTWVDRGSDSLGAIEERPRPETSDPASAAPDRGVTTRSLAKALRPAAANRRRDRFRT